VDDNATIRRLICERFIHFGFEICGQAENGKDGIEKAAEFSPDLIVLDVSMPIMSGLQAAPELKRILPDTPIILFTQYGNAIAEGQVRLSGVDALVSKSDPVDLLVEKAKLLLGLNGNGSGLS
jgi:CheY-like chemotaxis protein